MNGKFMMAVGSAVAALCAGAAEFPSAGGDISANDATGWNGAKPGTSEEAKFTKAGTYTASDNVTFGSVNLATSGLIFDLTTDDKTVTLSGETPMVFPEASATLDFEGGTWSVQNKKNIQVKNVTAGTVITLSDGCVWTGLGNFTASFARPGVTFRVLDNASITADSMQINQWGNGGSPTKVEVGSGGAIHITNTTLETNAGSGTYGGNWIDVYGAGSLLDIANDCNTSYRTTDDGLRIRDGATLKIGGTTKIGVNAETANAWMEVLNGATATVKLVQFNSSNGLLCVSNATMNSGKLNIGANECGGNRVSILDGAVMNADELFIMSTGNRLEVGNASFAVTKPGQFGYQENADVHDSVVDVYGEDAVLTIPTFNLGTSISGKTDGNAVVVRDGAEMTVGSMSFVSCGNWLTVSNATYTATNDFRLGYHAGSTGNVLCVTGPQAIFSRRGGLFSVGSFNRAEFSDGASWRIGGQNVDLASSNSSNCILRVTGGATISNKSTPEGDHDFSLYGTDARLEITDGGMVDVERFFVYGARNRIVVSNGTLKASSTAGYGIWMRGKEGTALIVRGTTPSVHLNEYKSSGGSAIRFEVPAEGYADGYVPVTARVLNPGSTATEKFEIECSAWAANPDATPKLVLMRCTTDISAANAAWIFAQNPNLPENVKLKVKGGDVILYKPAGLMLIVR